LGSGELKNGLQKAIEDESLKTEVVDGILSKEEIQRRMKLEIGDKRAL